MTTGTGKLLLQYAGRIHNAEGDGSDTDELLLLGALVTRDSLADAGLTPNEEIELGRLDAALVAQWKVFAEILPWHLPHPRSHWWWFLNEGPQVREEANHLDTEPTQA